MKILLKTQRNAFFIFALVTFIILFVIYFYGEPHFSLNLFAFEQNKFLFCIILTTPNNFQTKTSVVHRTWAKDCDKYFFVTKMNNTLLTNKSHEFTVPFPILQPAFHTVEVYDKLTSKVYLTFQDLYLRYNDYKWYLKADDDTFIFTENLKEFLQNKNESLPVTYGFNMNLYVDRGYHSGGAGYILSNKALKLLGEQLTSKGCESSGVEDVDIAKCLRKVNVYPGESADEQKRQRFHPFNITMHFNGNVPDWFKKYTNNPKTGFESWSESSISFHYMSPNQIKKIYSLWTKLQETSQKPYNLSSILYKMVNYS